VRVRVPVGLVRDSSLPAEARLTYLVLATYCSGGNGRCALKRRDLMKAVGVRSPTTMRGYLRMLAERGWLEFEYARSARQTVYVLHDRDRERMEAELAEMRRHLECAEFKGEALMKEWLSLRVDSKDYADNVRPGFLENPASGENLEFDRWYFCGVAFEFNGPQHYGPTERYPDPERARQAMARDALKRELAEKRGIKVVVIRPEDLSYDGIGRKINGLLPLRDVLRDDPRVAYLTKLSVAYQRKVMQGG